MLRELMKNVLIVRLKAETWYSEGQKYTDWLLMLKYFDHNFGSFFFLFLPNSATAVILELWPHSTCTIT